MADLHAVLADVGQRDATARELAERLEAYVGEVDYAGLSPGPTNVDLSRRLVAFTLRDIPEEPEHLRAVAIHLVTASIWGRYRDELVPRYFLIDEAGSVIRFAWPFMKKVATRARKYWLAPVFNFQTVEQVMVNAYGREVLDNCATVMLKRHPQPDQRQGHGRALPTGRLEAPLPEHVRQGGRPAHHPRGRRPGQRRRLPGRAPPLHLGPRRGGRDRGRRAGRQGQPGRNGVATRARAGHDTAAAERSVAAETVPSSAGEKVLGSLPHE